MNIFKTQRTIIMAIPEMQFLAIGLNSQGVKRTLLTNNKNIHKKSDSVEDTLVILQTTIGKINVYIIYFL